MNAVCLSTVGDRKRSYRTITHGDYSFYREEIKLKIKN